MDQVEVAERIAAEEAADHNRPLDHYRRILELPADVLKQEHNLYALHQKGNLLKQLGQPLEAYKRLYLEAGSSKEALEALRHIADLQRVLGRREEALQAWREAQH